MKKFITALLACTMLLSASACGNGTNSDDSGKTTVSVMVYSAGYGMKWLEETKRIYEESHDGVSVKISGDPLAFETVKTKLENGNCKDDIILIGSEYYRTFVAKGYIEDLTDVYESDVEGRDKKVKDMVSAQIINTKTVNDKLYGIPWQQNNGSGLIYNVKMFNQYGWKKPETMKEFFELCEKIDSDTNGAVSPLIFGGADSRGYTDYNLCQWLCEYYGYDAMMRFLKLESPDAFAAQSEGRTKIYRTLATLMHGKMSSGRPYAVDGSVGMTAITAQTNFVNGKVAMIINGQWLPTEMDTYVKLRNFEMGYIPMPHINDDKKSGDGKEDTSDIRFSTDGNLMVVPSTSQHKEIAKDFLKYMFTEQSYTAFVKENNGLLRPFDNVAVNTQTFSDFAKEACEYFNLNGKARMIYQVSEQSVLERGKIALFMAYGGGFFSRIGACADYDAAIACADSCFGSELNSVKAVWDSASGKWK